MTPHLGRESRRRRPVHGPRRILSCALSRSGSDRTGLTDLLRIFCSTLRLLLSPPRYPPPLFPPSHSKFSAPRPASGFSFYAPPTLEARICLESYWFLLALG
ncbi:unnamed protein product [Urochloa humidicola]